MIKFLKTRRATRALADAMRQGNEENMRQAISQGADLSRVSDTFDEPGQHFRMSYEVRGALELAIEHRLPLSAFSLLVSSGAPVPRAANGSVDPRALFNHEQLHYWPQAKQIIDLIENDQPAPVCATLSASRMRP